MSFVFCVSFAGAPWRLTRVSLTVCIRVCALVFVCDDGTAESNKAAEMVPSELHDWSIEFHHGDWLVGLNGSPWVTRLKHHTGFISLLIGLSPSDPDTHTAARTRLHVCARETTWSRERDYEGLCWWESGWKRFCVLKRCGEVLWVMGRCASVSFFFVSGWCDDLRFAIHLWNKLKKTPSVPMTSTSRRCCVVCNYSINK